MWRIFGATRTVRGSPRRYGSFDLGPRVVHVGVVHVGTFHVGTFYVSPFHVGPVDGATDQPVSLAGGFERLGEYK